MNETFATRQPLTLSVAAPAGTVEIEAADTTETTVEVERLDRALDPSEVEIRLRDEDGGQTLDVRVGRRRFKDARYRVVVRTHPGTDLRIDTGSADIRADGEFGSARLRSASGDVVVDDLRGSARVRTASGDVTIASARDEIDIDSASGSVNVGTAHKGAHVHSVSGDVTIEEALRDLTARTVSGDMRIGSVARGDVTMHSVSGDIDVGIRTGSKAYIDVHSVSGDMRSELDMTAAPSDDDPDLQLRAKTVSGDVAIRRAVAQAA